MPRMYARTTLLAAALLTSACLGLLGTASAVAQDQRLRRLPARCEVASRQAGCGCQPRHPARQ